MLIKETRLHPGVPLQVYVPVTVDLVGAEVVIDGMVEAEVVGWVNMVITELII